ncbi:MAG: hypothetical protein V8Q42_06010 [Anaerovoracaceae bacterium]
MASQMSPAKFKAVSAVITNGDYASRQQDRSFSSTASSRSTLLEKTRDEDKMAAAP